MNVLIENKYIVELECGSNFSYILNDSNDFSSTDYKVLQSQENSGFVKCMKMMYNGKMQLFYLTKDLKSLSSMLNSMDADGFLTIISNLISNIIDVKNNGFLSCQNIEISFERIYINPTTYKVSLVYLPLSKRMFDDSHAFENELRTNLVKLISENSSISNSKTVNFSNDLSNGSLTLEDLQDRLKGSKSRKTAGVSNMNTRGTLRLIAMNAPETLIIEINKDEFVIGKKQDQVDGVISFNKMISRIHCKINTAANHYTITDLHSANGTFVNYVRLQPNQPHQIKSGDIIRLADSDFQVNIL